MSSITSMAELTTTKLNAESHLLLVRYFLDPSVAFTHQITMNILTPTFLMKDQN